MMKRLLPICFMTAVIFIGCIGMEPKEKCGFCLEECNAGDKTNKLIFTIGCRCSKVFGTPIPRVYHADCFADYYKDARYHSKKILCLYCRGEVSLQSDDTCYLCPESLTKEGDNVEICCSCKMYKGHRSCFKLWYKHVKCNNEKITCGDCHSRLILRAMELVSYENEIVCSLCLESLENEHNIIQTQGCACWVPHAYHKTCYEDLSQNANKCPKCKDWLDYKEEVLLFHDGKQLSHEEIAHKLKKNFNSNMRWEVVRTVGAVLLASSPFWSTFLIGQYSAQ